MKRIADLERHNERDMGANYDISGDLAAEHKVSHLMQKLEIATAKNASLTKYIES